MPSPLQQFVLPRALSRVGMIGRIALVLGALAMDRAWRVEIHEHVALRTVSQNRLLWAIYQDILRQGGENMAGWTRDDLHEFFLMNHFGHETKILFGRRRLVPLKRSSRLNKQEFSDFVESILRFMAERGVYIRDPEEYRQELAA